VSDKKEERGEGIKRKKCMQQGKVGSEQVFQAHVPFLSLKKKFFFLFVFVSYLCLPKTHLFRPGNS
jgi:hypothetical protein